MNKQRFFRINENLLPVLVRLINDELSSSNNYVVTGVTKSLLLKLINDKSLMDDVSSFSKMKIDRSAIGRTVLATDEEVQPLFAAKKRYGMSITKIINALLTLKQKEFSHD